jgi:thiosulfate/3-mercaptopyruvate sulfurtransferase
MPMNSRPAYRPPRRRSRRCSPLPFAAALVLLGAGAALPSGPPAAVSPGSARESLLVSTSWLAEHLADPALLLLHVGDRAEYDKAHLPGARFVSQREISAPAMPPAAAGAPPPAHAPGTLMLQMLPADELRSRLAALGISDGSRVVVYFGNDWVSPATRILYTLHYAGLGARAALLDGGQAAWMKEGRAVTTEVPAPRQGSLAPLRIQPSIVDASFVLEHRTAPGYALLDARDAVYYDGIETGGEAAHPHRRGHVPGARSLPFSSITTDDLHLLPPDKLQRLFDRAGVEPGDVVIAYCHIGQQATAVLFAARSLGFDVRLYDGSFEDWSQRAELPVEGPAPAPAPAGAAAP